MRIHPWYDGFMRVAVLAPPYLPVPPPLYGGTEKIVSLLTEGLVAKGHDVTLFASGDSKTTAKLSSIFPVALGNSGLLKTDIEKPLAHYKACYDRAAEFDIIHSHGQYLSLAGSVGIQTPVVFTWHGSFYKGETPEEKRAMLQKYPLFNYISISFNQRGGMDDLHYVATVYNALNISEYRFVPQVKKEYLLWIGRMSPKKGAYEAILAAKKAGIRLEMAAAIDPIDRNYFEEKIKPLIDGKSVIYHGEIGHEALVELYGGAMATLYPISWHEPFGLVMTESMACGTPVIAYNIGSVPEIIRDGMTGFIIEEKVNESYESYKSNKSNTTNLIIKKTGIEGLIEAIKCIGEIDRSACRKHVEDYFSKDRMIVEYISVYKILASKGQAFRG